MVCARQSKRKAGGSPLASSLGKQRRQPNYNSLKAFSAGQSLPWVGKRRKRKLSIPKESNPSPSRAGSDPPISPTHTSLLGTPLASRTKKLDNLVIKTEFDPKAYGNKAHPVSITFYVIINGKEKKGVMLTTDISDPFQPTFKKLQDCPYTAYVRSWEDGRRLKQSERTHRGDWTVIIGNPKTGSKIHVSDEEGWKAVCAYFR
jgi:hypothetical protein